MVSTDLLVEGTHWREGQLKPRQLGRRALVANLSDLAAMGARPRWFTLGLGMPPSQPAAWLRGLIGGLIAAADEFSCPLIGGDLVRSAVPTIAITVGGECVGPRAITRSAARPGQRLCVTGDLGRAKLALEFLEHPPRSARSLRRILERHRRPEPRLREAEVLVQLGAVKAMMDVSDGIASDLKWICELSGVGAEVRLEALPILREVADLVTREGLDPAVFALSSGEEFELLFTTPWSAERIKAQFQRRGLTTRVTEIGRITSSKRIWWLANGRPVALPGAGVYEHFSHGGGPSRM